MLLSTMSKQEVLKCINDEYDYTKRIFDYFLKDIKKFKKTHRGYPQFFGKIYTSKAKIKYYYVYSAVRNRRSENIIDIFVELLSDEGRIHLLRMKPDDNDYLKLVPRSIFTNHSLMRYKQRTMIDNEDVYSIISTFILNNRNLMPIYDNAKVNNTVLTCKDGLLLCSIDEKWDLPIINTFISNDMLNNTQFEAKLYMDLFMEMPESEKNPELLEFVYKQANSVYGKYYAESKDYLEFLSNSNYENHKLNFTLKKKETNKKEVTLEQHLDGIPSVTIKSSSDIDEYLLKAKCIGEVIRIYELFRISQGIEDEDLRMEFIERGKEFNDEMLEIKSKQINALYH